MVYKYKIIALIIHCKYYSKQYYILYDNENLLQIIYLWKWHRIPIPKNILYQYPSLTLS